MRDRRALLERLRDYDKRGLGGIPVHEIREAVYNPDRAMTVSRTPFTSHPPLPSPPSQRLMRDDLVMKISRPDKEEIIFYNDPALVLPVAEQFRGLWHRVSVDGLTEGDIDKHLQSIGVGAMQGDGRKRRTPMAKQRAKKKSRITKVLNTHLDSSLLKDYSEKTS